jgi:plasmid stabilization system protein ParE
VKVLFRQAAADDVSRQFRYYLFTDNLPEVAVRFRAAVQRTVDFLRQRPFVGPRYHSREAKLQSLRSWPVAGFEAIRLYYLLNKNTIQIIRVLHGKRDLSRILERETTI